MTHTSYVLAPSILSADFLHLADQIKLVEQAGADWLHLDVMDGHFVPNLSMGPMIIKACRSATSLPLDVHLMVQEPGNLLAAFAEAGADHLTVHFEACEHIQDILGQIRGLGLKAGVSLKPSTPIRDIQASLPWVDGILVMSVDPGYSGQKFLPSAPQRISDLRNILDTMGSKAWLAVDGGINVQTLPLAKEAGADTFMAASSIFQHPAGITAGIKILRDLLV